MPETKTITNQKKRFRSFFPHTERGQIYMNHASISPLSVMVRDAMQAFIEERNTGPVEHFEKWMGNVKEVREKISRFIHAAGPDRITFTSNTSDGLSAIAEGFTWKEGDEIILNTEEFPSNIQPFRVLEKLGVRMVYVSPEANGIIPPEKLEDAITDRTKMLSISAVQYLSGFKADLEAIGETCRRNNLFFVVDGIQGLGAADINVQACKIDALATGGHKWLMSPMGTGFLYISERIEPYMAPAKTGWLSVEDPWKLRQFDQPWKPLPQHLETGTYNIIGLIGMNAAMNIFLDIGINTISTQIEELATHLIQRLNEHGQAKILTSEKTGNRAGIVSFSIDGKDDADTIVQNLRKQNMMVSAREGFFRISPHFYNTKEEIDYTLHQILNV
jgi:cysteine desulfurase / selenocysteine lyase